MKMSQLMRWGFVVCLVTVLIGCGKGISPFRQVTSELISTTTASTAVTAVAGVRGFSSFTLVNLGSEAPTNLTTTYPSDPGFKLLFNYCGTDVSTKVFSCNIFYQCLPTLVGITTDSFVFNYTNDGTDSQNASTTISYTCTGT